MTRLREAHENLPAIAEALDLRVLYTDLDGTLFGPGGSLFTGSERGITLQASIALAALHERGVEVVPVSGRTAEQVREAARILGAVDFIAEVGTVRSFGGRLLVDSGTWRGEGTPFEAMARSGAAGLLLEAYPGRLEPHAPWAFAGRTGTMLLRGGIDVAEARARLDRAGYPWLDVVDNGSIHRAFPGLEVEDVHAYHLAPRGVDKASAVGRDMADRGLEPRHAAGVGDAPSDAAMAAHVGAVFVVANGRAAVEAVGAEENVYVTRGERGDGFAEAVLGLLHAG